MRTLTCQNILILLSGTFWFTSMASASGSERLPRPLAEAIANENTNQLHQLLQENPKWKTTPYECGGMLGLAARGGRTNVIRALLEFGVDPNAPDATGQSALSDAAEWCQLPAIRALVAGKARLEFTNILGQTPLFDAIKYHDCTAPAEELLKLGANPNAMDTHGNAPLICAVTRASLPKVKLLLAHGARLDATNYFGGTAIMFATRYSNYEVAHYLLAMGADVKGKDVSGRSALSWARSPQTGKADPELVRLLVEKEAVEGKLWKNE